MSCHTKVNDIVTLSATAMRAPSVGWPNSEPSSMRALLHR